MTDEFPIPPPAKGVGKALINGIGFLSYLFGSLILLAIAVGAIGGIFMSTKRLFQVKRVKRQKDNSHTKPEGQIGKPLSNGQGL